MVNVQNAGCYFAKLPKIDAIHARKLIAQQLILNKYIQNAAQSYHKCCSNDHKLVTLPTFRKFKKIPQWSDAKTNIRSGTASVRLHM